MHEVFYSAWSLRLISAYEKLLLLVISNNLINLNPIMLFGGAYFVFDIKALIMRLFKGLSLLKHFNIFF